MEKPDALNPAAAARAMKVRRPIDLAPGLLEDGLASDMVVNLPILPEIPKSWLDVQTGKLPHSTRHGGIPRRVVLIRTWEVLPLHDGVRETE